MILVGTIRSAALLYVGLLLAVVMPLGCEDDAAEGTKETESVPVGDPTQPGAPMGPEIVRPPSATIDVPDAAPDVRAGDTVTGD